LEGGGGRGTAGAGVGEGATSVPCVGEGGASFVLV
jgi:hypothetical protein